MLYNQYLLVSNQVYYKNMYKYVLCYVMSRRISELVFLGLAKVFDPKGHKKFIYKLENIAIKAMAMQLIKIYLYERKQIYEIKVWKKTKLAYSINLYSVKMYK